jgi:flavin-dependent dehydrogenase
VTRGTHRFRAHGVLFYPRYILPGYVALFLHYDGSVDLGCYVIPGGAAQPSDLKDLYETEIARDPFLRAALGPGVEYDEPVRIAPLRMGGVPRSWGHRFLAVGDAAGHTDPLTGEGIHTAMIAGRIAARTIAEGLVRGEDGEAIGHRYHERWMEAFGRDFAASAAAARLIHRAPFLLDAANVVAQRKGDGFMADFGAAMTGVAPKTVFLRPAMAGPLAAESVRQGVGQLVRALPRGPGGYARGVDLDPGRPTSFRAACLR